jgi:membrane protease YdiL (CAAX protease family)
MPNLWGIAVVGFPVVLGAFYQILFYGIFGDDSSLTAQEWAYFAVTYAYVGGIYAIQPLELTIAFKPWYLLAPLAGVCIYWIDMTVAGRVFGGEVRVRSIEFIRGSRLSLISVPEEVLFRAGLGFLVGIHPLVYVVASSVIFGAHHYRFGMRNVVMKTANGIVYCTMFLASGSLVVPILAHASYNIASAALTLE